MLYFENASRGAEGFNTHVMSYTLAVSLANFLGCELFFDFEIPSSTPPDFAHSGDFRDKFSVLLESERSLVSDLLVLPVRRAREIGRSASDKLELQLVPSYFVTTDELLKKFGSTIILESFGAGRIALTREYLQSFDLIEWTHTKLSHTSFFYFLQRAEKTRLLDTVRLKYLHPIEALAAKIVGDLGFYNAAHLRFGDFQQIYRNDEFAIDPEAFRLFVNAVFPDREIPILIATDGLHERATLDLIFRDRRLVSIDEMIFERYRAEFEVLPFSDFNVLTVLDQLICAAAESFVGTYRSTFTGIIHRLRQERYRRKDFNFFPDEKVARLLSPDGRIVPDRHGFFDWNRYSAFAEDHSAMAWKREWDHDLSAID